MNTQGANKQELINLFNSLTAQEAQLVLEYIQKQLKSKEHCTDRRCE